MQEINHAPTYALVQISMGRLVKMHSNHTCRYLERYQGLFRESLPAGLQSLERVSMTPESASRLDILVAVRIDD